MATASRRCDPRPPRPGRLRQHPTQRGVWSIALEWHIYLFFPLLLWGFRRFGAIATSVAALLAVSLIHLLRPLVPALGLFDRFTPQFFALFVLGMLATALGRSANARRYASWAGLLLCCLLFLACAVFGSRVIVAQYFWVDLVVGMAAALAFIAMLGGRLGAMRRVLAAAPLVTVGRFAFSLYLIHAPVLAIVHDYLVQPLGWSGVPAFLGLLLIGTPLAFAVSYLFFLVFERPFLRIRSWRMFKDSLRLPRRYAIRPAPENRQS